MDLIFYAIIGAVLVLVAAFLALLFVSRKTYPDQGVVSKIAANIKNSQQMDKVPPVTPVEVVTPNPVTNMNSSAYTQAIDPATGGSMVQSSQGAMPMNPNLNQAAVNNQMQSMQKAQTAPLEEVTQKIEELDKKLNEVNAKVESTNNN